MTSNRLKVVAGICAAVLILVSIGYKFVLSDGNREELYCTAIGCFTQARVEIGPLPQGARLIRLCVNDTCYEQSVHQTRKLRNDVVRMAFEVPDETIETQVEVRLAIVDRKNRVVAEDSFVGRTHPYFPNGELCGDPCQEIDLRFADGRLSFARQSR